MRRSSLALAAIIAVLTSVALAQQATAPGPYSVLKTTKVGGLGGFDYIYADVAGRRLYIPRGAVQGAAPLPGRVIVWDLDTLAPVGEIPNVRANGAVVDAKSGHGFASSKPVAMWDTKTLAVIKSIDLAEKNSPDGILADAFNQRIYVFSHPTQDATVIDAKDGTSLGIIDLGGVPEQGVSDGKGTIYVVLQDKGQVAVVDAKTMKTTAHYDFVEKANRCNGLALDVKNQILFAACGQSTATPPAPIMVILSAKDGTIITTLPLAGSSDGAVFNPATMEAFSSHGNGTMTIVKEKSPTSFEVEQDLKTMVGAKCLTLDSKTNHILTMAAEYGPPPTPATPPTAVTPPTPPTAVPPPTPPTAVAPPTAGGPPAGGAPQGRGGGRGPSRGPMLPDSFSILVVGK